MKEKRSKKPILLLILLIGFSLVTVKIISKLKVSEVEINAKMPEECQSCNNQKKNQLIEDISQEEIIYVKQEDTVKLPNSSVGGSVKGISSLDCGSISADTLIASMRKTCSNGSGDVDFKDGTGNPTGEGVVVTKDTDIKIESITYPLALFLGQSTYQDSNKQIRKESPEYRSNGQQIDVEYVTRNLSPKESEEFSKSLNKTEKVPFKVEAEVKLNSEGTINSSNAGEYAIANLPHNPTCKVNGEPCKRELAISDFNVEKTNNLAADPKYGGYLTIQAPGGDNYERKEEKSCLVEDENYTIWTKGIVESCRKSPAAKIEATFRQIFAAKKWKRCTVGEVVDGKTEYETCIDTKNIGIKMTAIFGDPYECTDDLCANAMLVDRYRSVLSPTEADGTQEVSTNPSKSLTKFVATECEISIDGHRVPVFCLWDASVYLLNYQLQASGSAPQQEDFPENFNTYWKAVKKSSDISADRYGIK